MSADPIRSTVLWSFGDFQLTDTVATTWLLLVVIGLLCIGATRRLEREPGRIQTVTEGIVLALHEAIEAVAPGHATRLLPFIGSLWIFLVTANLTGLIPGLSSPTASLSATTALALLVFASVHWFGIRALGLKDYLKHYLAPTPILLPFHLISEITRTVALAIRLFGNIMSLEMAALLILMVAGFLVPVPILMLHIIEALVQAYIFGMLALIYIASGLELQQHSHKDKK